jgi:hypothetical protein
MHAIKTIAKFAFLGAFLLGFVGLFIGGVAALFIWPGSNLGPPVGAVYGLGIGILAGGVLGCAFGLVRLAKPGPASPDPGKNDGPH